MNPREGSFRVTLYLSYFYHDHRSVCRIFVSDRMKTVKDLKSRISEIFGLENFYLTSQNHFLPDEEDVRILQQDDVIIAIPNKIPLPMQTDEIPIVNETICTPKSKESEREKKKRKIAEIAEPEEVLIEVEQPCSTKKKKKKKKEKHAELNSENIEPAEKNSAQHSQTYAKDLPSKTFNNESKAAKVPENTKLSETINYFETLKTTPFPKTASQTKILNVEPKVIENLTDILENKCVKSQIVCSSPNIGSENTSKINIQPLNVESDVKDSPISDPRGVKSNIFYSSTPKMGFLQNRSNCTFGPPLMKIERKINIVKNIVTQKSNIVCSGSNALGNNVDIRNNIDERVLTDDMEIDQQDTNNVEKPINKIKFINKSSDIDTVINNNKPVEVRNISNVEKPINKIKFINKSSDIDTVINNNKPVEVRNISNVRKSEKYPNFVCEGNKEYPHVVDEIMMDNSVTVSTGVEVDVNKQDSLNSVSTIFNDRERKISVENVVNSNNKNYMRNASEIVTINDSASNNNTSFKMPSTSVSKIKVQDAISIGSNSENSVLNSELETMSISSEYVTIRSKRKRIRKRRKKTSECVVEMPDPIIPFKPMVCEASPKVHIRFDDKKQDCKEDSVISIRSENESSIDPIVNISDVKFIELQDTERKNVIENEQRNGDENCGINEKIILGCPRMKSLTPKQSDIITFKILKMSEFYTPEHSNYITGKVESYDAKTGNIDLCILDGRRELDEPQGKFSLIDDNEVEDEVESHEIITLNWNNLVEPRLLYP